MNVERVLATMPAVDPRRAAALAAIVIGFGLLLSGGAAAQSQGGCRAASGGGGAVVLSCGGGLVITMERTTRYQVVDRDRNGTPEGVIVDRGAVFVAKNEPSEERFQILTPVAIAAVRGTRYAVDAARGETAVFVEEGAVNVVVRDTGAGVVLRPGEGTDVSAGDERLVARRWGQDRIDALLGRLGQR